MEFSKGLQRLYHSCKHSITHVITVLSCSLAVCNDLLLASRMYLMEALPSIALSF